ncbi:MAG TPA: radical SAM protein [Polyangiaceae bacterium]|nr:radical SAM protein [Polyangiaceae bacterium]
MTPAKLAAALSPGMTEAEARKVIACVHRGEWSSRGLSGLQGVRRIAMDAARAGGHVPALQVRKISRSAIDPFVKVALATADGQVVEAVRIPLERTGRFSACVSSQAGCALACTFCATGRLGLARNLATWEIVEQVRTLRSTLDAGQRIHGVVFQGMGEPLANLDRVVEAVEVMCNPSALAIDSRNITVCTSGQPTGIRRLARDLPKVRLGLSIASARRDVRRRLMPIDAAHPLDEVIEAAVEHARMTGLAPMWAVTPLAGVNDSDEDAVALAALARRFEAAAGVRPRVSVVPYNATDVAERDPYSRGDVNAFLARLTASGLRPHLRYSGGGDVAAACGQLAGRNAGDDAAQNAEEDAGDAPAA